MKARDVVGKRILAINQERVLTTSGWVYRILSIDLDDGDSMLIHTAEVEDEPPVAYATLWRQGGSDE